jgi:hypothetical protein
VDENLKCYNCGKFGHILRDCPLPTQIKACYKCQATDHKVSKHCPVLDVYINMIVI